MSGYFGGVPRLLGVCSVPGCPELCEPGRSRCAKHARDSDRGGAHYRQAREVVLQRDGGRCQAVVLGANPAECSGRIESHHILPVEMGGTDDPENMVAICRGHNNAARRSKSPRWALALERHGPPALCSPPRPARPEHWPPSPFAQR